jgi:CubicO group peptidase (beta-lactamase class C family)
MPYAEYLQRTIFDPLGMRDTVFGVPARLKGRFPTVYSPRADGTLAPDTADAYARFTDHHFATLSLSGTARDYLRFSQMLLNGGELDGVRILGTKTVELMRQNHLPPNIPSITPGSTATGWGLGVSVTLDVPALGRLNSVGSFGWSGAATTTFSVDPQEKLTYVILAQLMPNDTALMQRVETLIYQAIVD